MSQKPGLKRDLAAERAARKAATQQARLVPHGLPSVRPDQLMPSPENGRKNLLKIDELADTLASDGMNTAMTVIAPDAYIEVYPQHKEAVEARVAEGVLFVVHHGHRRLAAALKAGLAEVPILVRRDVPSLRIAAIQENLQRMGLNPIEEALEFQEALNEKDGAGKRMSQRELAQRVSCSQTYISHRVALLRLVPSLRQAVVDHWLKEQRLLNDGQEEGVETSLLLPVRGAATVYARLRADLQEAYARRELTELQAEALSKLPASQQDPQALEVLADCPAISELDNATPFPEPRAGGEVASSATPNSPGQRTEQTTAPHSSSGFAAATPEAAESPRSLQSAAPTEVVEEPRGVIVVRGVDDLAFRIKDLLTESEVAKLRDLLSF